MTQYERHKQLCEQLNDLYRKKNQDYGDSFHLSYIEEGDAMLRIRLTDKLNRFKALTKNGDREVKDETVIDTLIDLANYALMSVIEIEAKEGQKNTTAEMPKCPEDKTASFF